MEIVLFIDELPGIGEGLERIGRGIPPSLSDHILLLLLMNIPAALMRLALRASCMSLEPDPFLNWVEGVDADELAATARQCSDVEGSDRHETVQSAKTSETESPAKWALLKATQKQRIQAQALLTDPVQLRVLVINTLRVCWEEHFKEPFSSHATAIDTIVSELPSAAQQRELPLLLKSLLGRSIRMAEDWATQYDRILLVPVPFMGPYVMSMVADSAGTTLILCFDASHVLRARDDSIHGPDLAKLKALADETRLEILRFVSRNERFGGEIVTHLGISQPGVSRHLRLLTASGLLRVRQEGTSKFYSIDDHALDAIADGTRQLKSGNMDLKKDGQQ